MDLLDTRKFLLEEASIWEKGNIDYIGRVKRNVVYKEKEIINIPLVNFLQSEGTDVPSSYRYAIATKAAEYKSIAKYDRTQPVFNQESMQVAENWLFMHFYPSMSNATISGVSEVLTEMNMSSSPGFPDNAEFGNKRDMLEVKGEEFLHEYVDKALKENDYPEPFWNGSLKLEMRPAEKVLQNKLRTFTASPFRFSVLLNVVCLAMNVAFYAAGHLGEVWSCVGISKYNRGWDKIAKRLRKHPNVFELDVSSFDASLFRFLFQIIAKFRNACLGGKWTKLMNRLYDTIVFAVIVLISGTVIRKKTGNPSGSANTVVDNTLILFLLLAYCWVELAPDDLRFNYAAFMENVEALLYGDDNTFSVSNKAVSFYNAINISKVFRTLEIEVTAGDDIWTSRSIYEVKFLSNKFVEYNNMFFPCPDYDKLMCSLIYGSRCSDVRWHLLRAYAIYMDGFWNVKLRETMKKYIDYLFGNYRGYMMSGVVRGDITMNEIKGLYKTDEQLLALYMSYENREIINIDGEKEKLHQMRLQ